MEQGWLMAMIGQDDKESYEDKLAFVEYLASFSNPEAVKQIIQKRKNDAKYLSDTDFAKSLGAQFGRVPEFKERS